MDPLTHLTPLILSFDPGITTGYALISTSGVLLVSGNLDLDDLRESPILEGMKNAEGLLVIMETVPIFGNSALGRRLHEVNSILEGFFPTAVKILPGTWKSIPSIINFPVPKTWLGKPMTPHQKDSYRMGMFFLIFRKGALDAIKRTGADSAVLHQ